MQFNFALVDHAPKSFGGTVSFVCSSLSMRCNLKLITYLDVANGLQNGNFTCIGRRLAAGTLSSSLMDGGLCPSLWRDAVSNLENIPRVVTRSHRRGQARCARFSGDAGFESAHISACRVY